MNYLMLSISSLVSLFDFGFASQFSRNISYIFSGAQSLKMVGFEENQVGKSINFRLLATAIQTSRSVYSIISVIVLFFMLTLGTLYMYFVTEGFDNIKNSLLIWITFSLCTFFNIYYSYYTALLIGKGLVKESKQALVYSKISYILISSILLLLFDFGLLGITVASLISPFLSRILSYRAFFSNEIISKISEFNISKLEKRNLFKIIWFNSRRLGLVFVGSYAITKFGMFLAGFYLTLEEISSYGLMTQLIGILASLSSTLFSVYTPKFAELRINKDKNNLLFFFSRTMGTFYFLFFLGSFFLVWLSPFLLSLIRSNVALPSSYIVIVYLLVILLEQNHSIFSSLIVIGNSVPFTGVALLSGAFIVLLSYLSLEYTTMGIFGLVLSQGLVQLMYNNWKWPLVVCRYFNISYIHFLFISLKNALSFKIKLN